MLVRFRGKYVIALDLVVLFPIAISGDISVLRFVQLFLSEKPGWKIHVIGVFTEANESRAGP